MRSTMSLLLAAILGAPLALGAQGTQAPSPAYGEAVDVEVVNVDVYVTDPAGNPVTGLTRDDFVLLESKKRLAIDYFYASDESRDRQVAGSDGRPLDEAPGCRVVSHRRRLARAAPRRRVCRQRQHHARQP